MVLQMLLLILEFLLSLYLGMFLLFSSCTQLDPSIFGIQCPELELPFGYYDAAVDGFELICMPPFDTGDLYLHLGSVYYNVKNYSVLEGYITIITGPIFILCPNNPRNGSGWFDLRGTPYTLSTRNKLTAIGCDNLALITASTGFGTVVSSGCVPFCETGGSFPKVTDLGSCNGLACCQAAIPRGTKSFELNLTKINQETDYYFECSQAFFVDQDISLEKEYFKPSALRDETYHEVVLEWAIGNKTCKQARNSESYACQDNSYCYDSPNGLGYLCNCTTGYTGIPYKKQGCIDIDECADPSTNPCVGICINTIGNVSCACPRGKRGDGTKNGSGCELHVFPLEIGLGVGIGTLFMLILGSFWQYWFLKKRELMKLKTKFFRQNGGLLLQQRISSQGNATMKIFSVEELHKATHNFDESNILGRGGYGTVYKGVLPCNRIVAIKKSRLMDESQIEQFVNEVVILSQINHRNVVKLLGCCLETQVPLLVYEFIPNGSLFQHIHNKEHIFTLSWDTRLRIAAETAGAIAYLHSAASIPIIHRDVKSANILLDQSYTAKVSDFGASRSVPFNQTHVTTLVQGTFGYLDPEYFRTSQLTEKSDVYSFGVVLAELMTRQMPLSFGRSETVRNLASYFTDLFNENRLLEVMEPEILAEAGVEQIFSVAQLVQRCLSLKGEERPTMKEVSMELEGFRRLGKLQMIDQHKEDELGCLEGGTGHSNLCTDVNTSRQFSLENHMILSANFPR